MDRTAGRRLGMPAPQGQLGLLGDPQYLEQLQELG